MQLDAINSWIERTPDNPDLVENGYVFWTRPFVPGISNVRLVGFVCAWPTDGDRDKPFFASVIGGSFCGEVPKDGNIPSEDCYIDHHFFAPYCMGPHGKKVSENEISLLGSVLSEKSKALQRLRDFVARVTYRRRTLRSALSTEQ